MIGNQEMSSTDCKGEGNKADCQKKKKKKKSVLSRNHLKHHFKHQVR
jgi:hypothetical protein